MSKSGVYPSAPLEMHEQHQILIQPTPPVPPTYEQATGAATPAGINGAATTAPPIVVVTQPIQTPFGPYPEDVVCPYCNNYARTRIRHRPTTRTHLIALLLCVLQLYCFVCLPYCMKCCLSHDHYCGMCDRYLGTYYRT